GQWGGTMIAVGQQGAILRRSGGAWSPLTPPARIQFSSLWAASADEMFVAGDEGALFHFDGTEWKRFESGTTANLDSIWGSSPRDVFAVGDADGAIVHFDGERWSRMESGTAQPLFSVCGTSPRDVFAVGMGGTILHFDGISWLPMLSGTAAHLTGVWCSSPADVYAVGMGGTILHYDGQTWSAMASGMNTHLTRVWGRSPADVFVIGTGGVILRNRGDGWRPLVSGTAENLYGISGNAETVVVVGRAGTILRLPADDRTTVEKTIRDAIGWALTKDRTRLENIMAHDADFFIFHPDSKSTVRGYESFAKMIPDFMDARFVATHFEVRDLTPVFSRSGDVAWFSAMLEDCGTWMGKESCWKETRWTGVLERRDGRWVIVQMHFSFAKDKVLAECQKAEAKEGSAARN
ncbi:MAG: nuclear transport factor 2 family protein, partial [Thermoanaerobaculia bacterium]